MADDILVFDTGESIVGIYSVQNDEYIPYMGKEKRKGIARLVNAKEVVTYNGRSYDLDKLRQFSGLPEGEEITLTGTHTDMHLICWGGINGSCLIDTYRLNCPDDALPLFDDTYEASAEQDCYMTFKLWQALQEGTLKEVYGLQHHNPPKD